LNINSSIPREYSQTTNWNPQSSNYKTTSKATMIPTGTYQQPSYQLTPQQQQFILGTYPYHTLSPTVKFLHKISIYIYTKKFFLIQGSSSICTN